MLARRCAALSLRWFQCSPAARTEEEQPAWVTGKFPKDEFRKAFVRSSGPGGQNVNQVSSKCELRFNVENASWMPDEVKRMFVRKQQNRINKAGEFVVSSDIHRFAEKNEAECFKRIQDLVAGCARQIEDANRQPTEEDLKRMKEKAEASEIIRRKIKDMRTQRRRLRSKEFF